MSIPEGTEFGTSAAQLSDGLNLLLGVMNDIEAETNRGELTIREGDLYRGVLYAAREVLGIRYAQKTGVQGMRFPDIQDEAGRNP